MTSTIQFLGGKLIELNRCQIVKGLAAGYIVAVGGCVQNQALGRQELLLVSDAQMTQLSALSVLSLARRRLSTQRRSRRSPYH